MLQDWLWVCYFIFTVISLVLAIGALAPKVKHDFLQSFSKKNINITVVFFKT